MTHVRIEPAIHYWGTPVALLTTTNPDGSTNVAPMSSVFWLGWSCMLGLDASSRTTENLRRTGECVVQLADEALAPAVDRLALTTGTAAVPVHKRLLGYAFVADKLAHAGLTTTPSHEVAVPRIAEAPVQLEAKVVRVRPFAEGDARMAVAAVAVELRIVAVHVDEALVVPGSSSKIDASRWRPLTMSFRRLFVRGDEVLASRLATGPESAYAPWKRGQLGALAGAVLGQWSRWRHGVPEDADGEAPR
ncbi:MAG: flavin reductase family protein [Sandaracinus sp.]